MAFVENSARDLVLGIEELVHKVLNGNCKISEGSADGLRKQKTVLLRLVYNGIDLGKKRKLICSETGSRSLYYDASVGFADSHTPVDMLRKMLLVSPYYFERSHHEDDEDFGARNEMHNILQKKCVHPMTDETDEKHYLHGHRRVGVPSDSQFTEVRAEETIVA